MNKRDILAEIGETIGTFILVVVGTAAFMFMFIYLS